MSLLATLKHWVQSALGLSPDTLLVLLGLGCYLLTCLVARRPLTWVWALAPGILISLALEAAEIWEHYGAEGLANAGSSGFADILLRHAKDVLVTNVAPILVFLTAMASSGVPRD